MGPGVNKTEQKSLDLEDLLTSCYKATTAVAQSAARHADEDTVAQDKGDAD